MVKHLSQFRFKLFLGSISIQLKNINGMHKITILQTHLKDFEILFILSTLKFNIGQMALFKNFFEPVN